MQRYHLFIQVIHSFTLRQSWTSFVPYYENEAPTTLDFLMFYLRFLKLRFQVSMEYKLEIDVFLQDLQTIAYDLSKSLMIDASLLKYKPSILSITLVNLGF